MADRQRDETPNREKVLAIMEPGIRYTAQRIARRLRAKDRATTLVLQMMVYQDELNAHRGGGRLLFSLVDGEKIEVTPPRTAPAFKPMAPYDLRAFQRRCEASRRTDKGCV